jgi:hypothetical protein
VNELKVRKKRPPFKSLIKNKSRLTLTPFLIISILLISSGAVMAELGYHSEVSYLEKFTSVDSTVLLGYNQTFSSVIGIEGRSATQVTLDSQYGNLSWGIWNAGSYTNSTGITISYNNEKFSSNANNTSYFKTFPAGTYYNFGFGYYYITVTNYNHKAQNVTVIVNILSPSTKFLFIQLIYIGISTALIGVIVFIAEITRISMVKSEGKHLLKDKDWPA